MRFTSPSARPALTPFGHRLLYLSESKLANLESPYEASALWKGVILREAVKAAWRSVDEGAVADLNDWHSKGAMGLDVIGEDEDEEYEYDEEDEDTTGYTTGGREERWFEDLVSSFGEDEDERPIEHEWVESNVSIPEFDDYEYEVGEAYTFPVTQSPPSTPLVTPAADPASSADWVVRIVAAEDDDLDDQVEAVDQVDPSELGLDVDAIERPHRLRQLGGRLEPVTPSQLPLPSPLTLASFSLFPITPVTSPLESPDGYPSDVMEYDDLDDCADDFLLPPPLARSFSSVTSRLSWTVMVNASVSHHLLTRVKN
ncbi:hypothetical protein BCR39DRAFT_226960 [Naematelia encephala]|uniref:Uncharacterized protein n=1 Tax=Naematelia encephala TaxID=71784 RepID=A0A1Y2AY26_9TREE|nr:hypothetical protein BCR39DRAFT_226960 [Naematelia encephala]